jgi:hypothetical protein
MPFISTQITRNDNYTQLFPTLCYLCTAYKHLSVRDYNHLLDSCTSHLLHVHAGWVLSYHYCLKLSHTLHLHTSRVSLVELLVANWMRRHFRSAYNSPIGPANNTSCCPVGLSEERLFIALPGGCGRCDRCLAEKAPPPLLSRSGQLTRNALLRNRTLGWHVTICLTSYCLIFSIHLLLKGHSVSRSLCTQLSNYERPFGVYITPASYSWGPG